MRVLNSPDFRQQNTVILENMETNNMNPATTLLTSKGLGAGHMERCWSKGSKFHLHGRNKSLGSDVHVATAVNDATQCT